MGGRTGTKITQHGTIGKQIFDQVEQLTAKIGVTRLAAFKQISEASGRQLGTVAANYYRVARQKGTPLRTRRPGRPPGKATNVASRVTAALEAVAAALRPQEEDLAKLRRQSTAFEKVRRLLKP